jgi:hypothetical protein
MPLGVALQVRREEQLGSGVFAVTVQVSGGTAPLRLLLYCDGALAGACDSVADIYEFRTATHPGARHAVTARVVDSAGQWGGASAALGAADLVQVPAGPSDPPVPHFTLRSSVRTRVLAARD